MKFRRSDIAKINFHMLLVRNYKTKKEKQWIASDTKKLQLSYRNKSFRDKLTRKIMPQARVTTKRGKTITLAELEKEFNLP